MDGPTIFETQNVAARGGGTAPETEIEQLFKLSQFKPKLNSLNFGGRKNVPTGSLVIDQNMQNVDLIKNRWLIKTSVPFLVLQRVFRRMFLFLLKKC